MNNSVRTILAEILPAFGFIERKGSNWYRDLTSVLHVIGIQKSRWGDSYYINLAVWIKCFGVNLRPKFYECHIQQRLEMVALYPDKLDSALSQEDYWKVDLGERTSILRLELSNAEFVFFEKWLLLKP